MDGDEDAIDYNDDDPEDENFTPDSDSLEYDVNNVAITNATSAAKYTISGKKVIISVDAFQRIEQLGRSCSSFGRPRW